MECYFKRELSTRRLPCPTYDTQNCSTPHQPANCPILEVEYKFLCGRWICSTPSTFGTTTTTTTTTARSTLRGGSGGPEMEEVTHALTELMPDSIQTISDVASDWWHAQELPVQIGLVISISAIVVLILFGCALKCWFIRQRKIERQRREERRWEDERTRNAGFHERMMTSTSQTLRDHRSRHQLVQPASLGPVQKRSASYEPTRASAYTSRERQVSAPPGLGLGQSLAPARPPPPALVTAPPRPPPPATALPTALPCTPIASGSRQLVFDPINTPCTSKQALQMDPLISSQVAWQANQVSNDPLQQATIDWNQGVQVVRNNDVAHVANDAFDASGLADLGSDNHVQGQDRQGQDRQGQDDGQQGGLDGHGQDDREQQGLLPIRLFSTASNVSNSSTATFGSASSGQSGNSLYGSAVSLEAPEPTVKRGRPVGARNRPLQDRLLDATRSFDGPLPRRSPRKRY